MIFNRLGLSWGDYLTIYDGVDTTAPIIAQFGPNTNIVPPPMIAKSGKMYVHMTTDGSSDWNGFQAQYFYGMLYLYAYCCH